jgi:hypothetical protein
MAEAINLADPRFEPSEEQLQALSREAFSDVATRHLEALSRLRTQIALLRAEAIARITPTRTGH